MTIMPILFDGLVHPIVGYPMFVMVLGPDDRRRVRRLLQASDDHDLFTDIAERVLEELRPGVYAQWADPQERLRGP